VDGWWTEIEAEIRTVVQRHPALTLEELARHLRVSQSGTASILRVLMIDQPWGSAVVLGAVSGTRGGAA
jgi:hypothetical protein